jgi:hypothetical protein
VGLIITEESELGKELAKWEQHPGRITQNPGNPYKYRPFPKMVYKAIKRDDGRIVCNDPHDEQFSRRCQFIVKSEAELEKANRDGWRNTPTEAMEYAEGLERDIAQAAAEAAFHAQRMSEKAQAELAKADAENFEHVTDVVPAKRGPGRPRKTEAA